MQANSTHAAGAPPRLTVVLGTYNRLAFLKETIGSIRAELGRLSFSSEIIVVDGGSSDGTLSWLTRQKDVITIVQHNRGSWRGKPLRRRSWGYFMNLGFRCAQGKYVCMLSDDCLLVPGTIGSGVELFERRLAGGERIGAVAFYWRNWPEHEKYWVGLTLGDRMFVNHGLYLKEALEAVGYVDEESYYFYHADGDLCLKMWQQGWVCVDSPDSYVEHFSHANQAVRHSNLEKQQQDFAAYLTKWTGTFYDPGLDNIGGWLLREFRDQSRTASGFRRAAPLQWHVRMRARALWSLLGKRAPGTRGGPR